MTALVFANGEVPPAAFLAKLHEKKRLIVAADGGARHALAAGFRVDAVVGDLDSVDAEVRATLPEAAFHRRDVGDTTDLEKAIQFCIDQGEETIDIVCAGGGRADHALANLSVLTRFRGRARLRILDELFTISLVDGTQAIDGEPGTVVSLVAIGECRGVTTHGLRWDLSDFTLPFSPRGIHNEIAAPAASVSVASGDLLLFRGNWIERHG